MTKSVPIVDSLLLGDTPRLVANACESCGARFLERRNGCASCGGTAFAPVELPASGLVRTYSIVHQAPPGVPSPYISCVVDLDDGTRVRSTLRGAEMDQLALRPGGGPGLHPAGLTGLAVRLVTFVAGTDRHGTDAIGYAFAPIEASS